MSDDMSGVVVVVVVASAVIEGVPFCRMLARKASKGLISSSRAVYEVRSF